MASSLDPEAELWGKNDPFLHSPSEIIRFCFVLSTLAAFQFFVLRSEWIAFHTFCMIETMIGSSEMNFGRAPPWGNGKVPRDHGQFRTLKATTYGKIEEKSSRVPNVTMNDA